MNIYQSLQSSPALPTRFDDGVISYPIMAKEHPANLGTLEPSMQDTTVQLDIAGPSEHRQSMAEIAYPYHIEAPEENASDTVEETTPHSLPMHSDPEGASVASQSTGAAVTNTTTDVHPWYASQSGGREQGGGRDDERGSEDGTHERDREWERERARRGDE